MQSPTLHEDVTGEGLSSDLKEGSPLDVLQLDISGRPQAWISAKEAAVMVACDAIAWTLGEPCAVLRGGIQRVTGRQSVIEVHPIVAARGAIPTRAWRQAPALTNPKLFARDRLICKQRSYSGIQIRVLPMPMHASPQRCSNIVIRALADERAEDVRISSAPEHLAHSRQSASQVGSEPMLKSMGAQP